MTIYQLVGLALLCACASLFLRENGGKFVPLVITAGCVLLFGAFLARLTPAVTLLSQTLDNSGFGEWALLLSKAMAIGYVTQIGADVCRDLGAENIGTGLELCGRAELLLLALPCITELLSMAVSLVSG